jgi:pSer/pThr/pTyr-binding forkhead associated (FHA) protein
MSEKVMRAIKVILMCGPDDGLEVWLREAENHGEAIGDGWQVSVGRHEDNDLVVPFDTQVSRRHAIIKLVDDKLLLEDIGSHNGTFVEHRKVEQATPIQVGQLLRMGYTWLTVAEAERE